MKNGYCVLNTYNSENGTYYPVICPVTFDETNILYRTQQWAGENYQLLDVRVASTKKKAKELCEMWRSQYKDIGLLSELLM